ncbi:MAG: CBS domain-containing protein [Deltaproteobacteria bacterium]|nr:CBS domain-containing protein [Deltaproteobacteria bacterium]
MRVLQLMRSTVRVCGLHDSLATAARIMWDSDCGCVPVVKEDGRLAGMITDRDVCMAAYLGGTSLATVEVESAMSRTVHSCRAQDSLASAENLMRAAQVRRLPVVDAEERVVGILSLSDIAREYARAHRLEREGIRAEQVAGTLAAVCQPHDRCASSAAA